MSNKFNNQESLKKLYRFLCFYRQFIEILKTIFCDAEISYLSDTNIERDYIWLVSKLEELFRLPEFEESNLPFTNQAKGSKLEHISSMNIPIKDLRLLVTESVDDAVYNYLVNINGFLLMNAILQDYEKDFLSKDKPDFFLEEKEQSILIESYLNLLRYKDKITDVRLHNLQGSIDELKQQSVFDLFQSPARIIEEFIKDTNTKVILTEDLEQAKLTFKSGAYKATILLCGGIMEELLKEALQIQTRQSFIEIINKAENQGIVKAITADLTHVTRIYRNTTHINTQKSIGVIKHDDAYIAIKSLNNVCHDMLDWYQKQESEE